MTRDEIRGLIGGYATDSLSETERETLFEAALDDQELFDELAREQALKELLEAPGVKARLIGALAPRRQRAGWANAWVWAATGAFAVAVIAGIVLFERPRELQIAQVIAPPNAPEPPVPAPVVPPPVVSPPVLSKEATPDIPDSADKKTTPRPSEAERAEAERAEADALKAEPPPAPAPAPAPAGPRQTNAPAAVGTLGGVSAGDLAAGGGGGGGGRGGGRGGAAAAGANRATAQSFAALAARPPRLAFDYSVTPEGLLRITPAAPGFLTVGVNNSAAATVLFSGRPVQAGSATEVMLPADATSAAIILEASPPSTQAREVDVSALAAAGALDAPAGTKSDSNPSPASRLIAVIPVIPRR